MTQEITALESTVKHFFNEETMEYTHTEELRYDLKGREKKWPNETKVPLPEIPKDMTGKVAFVFNIEEESWTLYEDHRGEEGFIFQEWKKINELGPLPKDFTKDPQDDLSKISLEEYKTRKVDKLDTIISTFRSEVEKKYSELESSTFNQQYTEAVLVNTKNLTIEEMEKQTPLLFEIEDGNLEDIKILSELIITKHEQSELNTNKLLGIKRQVKKLIEKHTSVTKLSKFKLLEKVRELATKKGFDEKIFENEVFENILKY